MVLGQYLKSSAYCISYTQIWKCSAKICFLLVFKPIFPKKIKTINIIYRKITYLN